jgi:tripartite-type tricarboxylate transporter receptor subunit TctC
VISPWIYKTVPYDPLKSFVAVTKLVDSPYVLLVNPKVPARNVQEFVALAKAAPNTIHYASSGNGSSQHLMGGLFASMTGAPIKHVPYKGSSGAANDLVAGIVESSFAGVPNALSQVPQGRLKALAVTTAKRHPSLPDVPALAEALPGFETVAWFGVLAPAATPKAVVDRMNAVINHALDQADVKARLATLACDPAPGTPEAFAQRVNADVARWKKLASERNIRAD